MELGAEGRRRGNVGSRNFLTFRVCQSLKGRVRRSSGHPRRNRPITKFLSRGSQDGKDGGGKRKPVPPFIMLSPLKLPCANLRDTLLCPHFADGKISSESLLTHPLRELWGFQPSPPSETSQKHKY